MITQLLLMLLFFQSPKAPLLVITTVNLPIGTVGLPYSAAFTASSQVGADLSWTINGLPTGLFSVGQFIQGKVSSVQNGIPITVSVTATLPPSPAGPSGTVTASGSFPLAICALFAVSPAAVTLHAGQSQQFSVVGGPALDGSVACNVPPQGPGQASQGRSRKKR